MRSNVHSPSLNLCTDIAMANYYFVLSIPQTLQLVSFDSTQTTSELQRS